MGFTLCFYIYFLSLPLKRKLVMNYSEEQFILGINQKNREVFQYSKAFDSTFMSGFYKRIKC